MSAAPQPRVVVIDDDDLVSSVLLAHLAAAGYDARATDDIETFLEWASSWSPAYVFVDLALGARDGLEVLSRLAASRSSAIVVIMSGSDHRVMHSAREFASQSGLANAGYLAKPFTRQDVANAMSREGRVASADLGGINPIAGWSAEQFSDAIATAISTDELSMVYQPKIACSTGVVIGFEALARWNHPTLGLISPASFIPRAEREGLMGPLTRAIMARSLEWFGAARATTDERLAVNISGSELGSRAQTQRLRELCGDFGVSPDRVILEVTETAALAESRVALEVLTRVRLDGFHLSIDDFGTGYSTMEQLTLLPFSELKIDTSFVRICASSTSAHVAVESAIAVARGLGLACVAEGVEDQRTLEKVTAMGCDYAQGYHIARPMPAPLLEDWLRSR